MMYQKYLVLLLLLLGNAALFAQTDTIDMSSEKERQTILEEMETQGKADKRKTKKTASKEKEWEKWDNLWALKTAPLSYFDLNFPSYMLEGEYQFGRTYGIVAGGGRVKGKYYDNTDADQRGFRVHVGGRYYSPESETWNFYIHPKIEWIRAWADKEVLVLDEGGGFQRAEQITTITRATDIQVQVGYQYISRQGFLLELSMGGGLRKSGIFPTEEFAHVDLMSNTDGFFRRGVQSTSILPVVRFEMRVGWAFRLKKKGK